MIDYSLKTKNIVTTGIKHWNGKIAVGEMRQLGGFEEKTILSNIPKTSYALSSESG